MVSMEPVRPASDAPVEGTGGRVKAPAPRLLLRGVLLALACLILVGVALRSRAPAAPALRIPLPAFELTNQRGERFGLAELRGRVWIANFIFTSCPTVCPKLTRRMAELEERGRSLGDALHLVSFTVDPENDTPQVLATYAASHHADPRRWTFVTGPLGDLEATVVKGFKMAMGTTESSPGIFTIFHGEHLVLVDREGVIRGYYEATNAGLDQILRDADALVRER